MSTSGNKKPMASFEVTQGDKDDKKRGPKTKNPYDKEPLLPKRNSTFNLLSYIGISN